MAKLAVEADTTLVLNQTYKAQRYSFVDPDDESRVSQGSESGLGGVHDTVRRGVIFLGDDAGQEAAGIPCFEMSQTLATRQLISYLKSIPVKTSK